MRTTLALLAALIPSSALAHETWLYAQPATAPPGETVSIRANSGMDFPALDYAIKGERLAAAALRCPGAPRAPLTRAPAVDLELRLSCDAPGLADVRISLLPMELELDAKGVAHYLDEIGATPALRAQWAAMQARGEAWRERYRKHAQLLLPVAKGGDRSALGEVLGEGFELVPDVDSLGSRTLSLRLLRDGKPVVGQPIGLRGNAPPTSFASTDADGRVRFPMPASRVLLHSTLLERQGDVWVSDFVTLSIDLSPE